MHKNPFRCGKPTISSTLFTGFRIANFKVIEAARGQVVGVAAAGGRLRRRVGERIRQNPELVRGGGRCVAAPELIQTQQK